MTRDKRAIWITVGRAVGVLAVFALLTTLHTWPLVPEFSTRINPNGDVPVNVWALNDLAGQILHDPKYLLDGRIHYPYPHTLAFVDHQIAKPASRLRNHFAGLRMSGIATCLPTRAPTTMSYSPRSRSRMGIDSAG